MAAAVVPAAGSASRAGAGALSPGKKGPGPSVDSPWPAGSVGVGTGGCQRHHAPRCPCAHVSCRSAGSAQSRARS